MLQRGGLSHGSGPGTDGVRQTINALCNAALDGAVINNSYLEVKIMEIVYKNPDDLIPYQNNPRINDHAVDKVASSINNYGFRVPLVIDPSNEIIAGHTRLKAARKLGMEKVPCIVADDLTQAQKKAFRITDNRTAEEADWDVEALRLEIEELESMEMDLENLGFEIGELEELIEEPNFEPVSEDEQPRLDEKKKVVCPECGCEFTP